MTAINSLKNTTFCLFIITTVFITSCKKSNTTDAHTVKYTIQGSAKTNVTYTDQVGNVQSVNNADANWTAGFPSNHHGLLLKLTVTSLDGSAVGGKIFIDGQESAQSNGAAESVSLTAVLP